MADNSALLQKDFWSFDELFGHSLMLMDGGLGTTLEDDLGSTVAQSPIWSAYPIAQNPEAIVNAHLKFLKAGARIILTATYQCSPDSMERAGFDKEAAKTLMKKGVRLANEARARFQAGGSDPTAVEPPIFVALSLGPLGATLRPTQEFGGYYPPPYGPREFVVNGSNENAFEEREDEELAINELARFHFDRLLIFAAELEIWDSIDCIAYETIPLRREIKAIRKAMRWLQRTFAENASMQTLKPWWISCVFLIDGDSPENLVPGGPKVQIDDLLDAAFRDSDGANDNDYLLKPSGFGINCTVMKYIPTLMDKIRAYFKTLETGPFWLVLYPNGNNTYDETRLAGIQDGIRKNWAQYLIEIIGDDLVNASDPRLLVGGCCRTRPEDIATVDRYMKIIGQMKRAVSLEM